MLTCSNITVERNFRVLFQNLGFSILPGGCVVICGNNGSGKTTLLRNIACLMTPQSGEVLYNQVNVRQALDEYFNLVCYIGDTEAIKSELTVVENLSFWASIYNKDEALLAALRSFDLHEYADIPVNMLSRGLRKKVHLAKLLLTNAKIWLLDEPFTHLDQNSLSSLCDLINIRRSRGGSVIITNHQDINLENVQYLNLKDFTG